MKNDQPITCIQVIDQFRDGRGGYAMIVGGGINSNWTQIYFQSQPGGHIFFNVTVFVSKNQSNQQNQHQRPMPIGWKPPMNGYVTPYNLAYHWIKIISKIICFNRFSGNRAFNDFEWRKIKLKIIEKLFLFDSLSLCLFSWYFLNPVNFGIVYLSSVHSHATFLSSSLSHSLHIFLLAHFVPVQKKTELILIILIMIGNLFVSFRMCVRSVHRATVQWQLKWNESHNFKCNIAQIKCSDSFWYQNKR